ncbi:MAG: 30S ribosomal protein S10 [Candidatus Levybacteria bacterium GW2011_GWA2_36_13]|nr:MAG: 30S ribosomal protein S10 [Candidatus Levybacteria bacterium GW2011_GWA2_36_13]
MPKGRIRVRLKSYDARVIDSTCQQILDTAIRTGAKVVGPIPLPTRRSLYAVNKSPFIDKDARDHFEIKVHKRLIDIVSPTDKTIELILRSVCSPRLSASLAGELLTAFVRSAGVNIEIKIQCIPLAFTLQSLYN